MKVTVQYTKEVEMYGTKVTKVCRGEVKGVKETESLKEIKEKAETANKGGKIVTINITM